MIKAVLDSNIYISAILFGGKAEEIKNLSREGRIEVFISEAILTEVGNVLKRKFRWQDWQISQVIDEMREFSTLVFPGETISAILEYDADNRILECAVAGGAHFIVSGDNHLLVLEEYQGIKILSSAAFLEEIRGGR